MPSTMYIQIRLNSCQSINNTSSKRAGRCKSFCKAQRKIIPCILLRVRIVRVVSIVLFWVIVFQNEEMFSLWQTLMLSSLVTHLYRSLTAVPSFIIYFEQDTEIGGIDRWISCGSILWFIKVHNWHICQSIVRLSCLALPCLSYSYVTKS